MGTVCNFEILYNSTHALAVTSGSSQSSLVGDFLFRFVLFGLLLSVKLSDRVMWDSLIAKDFIFEV